MPGSAAATDRKPAEKATRSRPARGDSPYRDDEIEGQLALARERGGVERENTTLREDNFRLREAQRRRADRIKELEKLVPAEGTVVLTGDDATEYAALKALGKAADVKKTVDEVTGLRTKVSTLEQSTLSVDAATALGYNAAALREVMQHPKFGATTDGKARKLAMRERDVDVTTNGVTAKVKKAMPVLVTGEGASETVEPLETVVGREFAVFTPALTAAATSGTQSTTTTTSTSATGTAAATGTPFPRQQASGTAATPPNPIDAAIARNQQRASAPNALRPAAPATQAVA